MILIQILTAYNTRTGISGIRWMDSVIHQCDTTRFFPPAITCGGFVVRFFVFTQVHVHNMGMCCNYMRCETQRPKNQSICQMFLIFLYFCSFQTTAIDDNFTCPSETTWHHLLGTLEGLQCFLKLCGPRASTDASGEGDLVNASTLSWAEPKHLVSLASLVSLVSSL